MQTVGKAYNIYTNERSPTPAVGVGGWWKDTGPAQPGPLTDILNTLEVVMTRTIVITKMS